jgi:hypothetical protein
VKRFWSNSMTSYDYRKGPWAKQLLTERAKGNLCRSGENPELDMPFQSKNKIKAGLNAQRLLDHGDGYGYPKKRIGCLQHETL